MGSAILQQIHTTFRKAFLCGIGDRNVTQFHITSALLPSQSRISVALHYGPLGLETRKTIWESYLKKAVTAKGRAKYTSVDLDWLSKEEVNGRQVSR